MATRHVVICRNGHYAPDLQPPAGKSGVTYVLSVNRYSHTTLPPVVVVASTDSLTRHRLAWLHRRVLRHAEGSPVDDTLIAKIVLAMVMGVSGVALVVVRGQWRPVACGAT